VFLVLIGWRNGMDDRVWIVYSLTLEMVEFIHTTPESSLYAPWNSWDFSGVLTLELPAPAKNAVRGAGYLILSPKTCMSPLLPRAKPSPFFGMVC
jgi:hypothetical protein